jgi:hypothetical protein
MVSTVLSIKMLPRPRPWKYASFGGLHLIPSFLVSTKSRSEYFAVFCTQVPHFGFFGNLKSFEEMGIRVCHVNAREFKCAQADDIYLFIAPQMSMKSANEIYVRWNDCSFYSNDKWIPSRLRISLQLL